MDTKAFELEFPSAEDEVLRREYLERAAASVVGENVQVVNKITGRYLQAREHAPVAMKQGAERATSGLCTVVRGGSVSAGNVVDIDRCCLCRSLILPGVNLQVRVRKGSVEWRCQSCGGAIRGRIEKSERKKGGEKQKGEKQKGKYIAEVMHSEADEGNKVAAKPRSKKKTGLRGLLEAKRRQEVNNRAFDAFM